MKKSPFNNAARPAVFVASKDVPYNNTRNALANIDLSPSKNKRVLLKPNIGRNVKPHTGITTHPQVIAAAIDAFKEVGADVAVGESPITGVNMSEAFENTGIKSVAEERNSPTLDMDRRQYVPADIPDGLAIKSLKLCPEINEYDIIVSIPVMKTHMHTGVTLSVKNMKGCLWRRSKVDLHMLPESPEHKDKPLDIAIADMSSVLRPHLSIIDGTIGLEGLGPSAGKPKPFDVVLVSLDAFAADSVACELMGISACDIPHLRIAADRGYGVIDLDKIDVSPEDWQSLRAPFAPPPVKLSVEFPGFTILDSQSCSACQSTLFLFLKDHGEQLRKNSPDKNIVIAIGKGHKDLPFGTLCIGNCTAKHKDCGIFVPGCPPVASEILREYFK
jgi:uncharacterized protein (DUF362 family)